MRETISWTDGRIRETLAREYAHTAGAMLEGQRSRHIVCGHRPAFPRKILEMDELNGNMARKEAAVRAHDLSALKS